MTEENAEVGKLKREIAFGFEVEDFIGSDIGQYLAERANAEREEALAGLANVDPEDAKAIRALQQRIAVAEQWQRWLEDAVNVGRAAQSQLVEAMG